MDLSDAYFEALEPYWDRISIYDGPETFLRQFAEAAPSFIRTIFAAHVCQAEVGNGGFHQFFKNSSGVLAPEAVEAFRSLGMPLVAQVVANAVAQLGDQFPRDRAERWLRLSEFASATAGEQEPFDAEESEFYRLIETESGGFDRSADQLAISHRGAPH